MMWRRKTDPKSGKHTLLRSQNAPGHKSHCVCQHLQEKCQTPIPQHPFCASLRSRNAHGHFTRAILCQHLQEKCQTPIPQHPFLRSRNAHGHFTRAILCGFFLKQNAARAGYYLDQTAGLNTHRKNLSVWKHCLGKHTLRIFLKYQVITMILQKAWKHSSDLVPFIPNV